MRAEERGQLVDRAEASARDRMLGQREQVVVEAPGLDGRAVRAAREIERTLELALDVRVLAGRELPDAVVDVVIELLDGDQPVLIAIGPSGLEPLDDGVREVRGLLRAGDLVTLEGVLHRARRGDHRDPAAVPLELARDVDALAAARATTDGERPAEAAVQQQHDAPRARPRDLVVEPRGRYARGPQQVQLGVGRREVELAALVLDPVAREVREQDVGRLPVPENAAIRRRRSRSSASLSTSTAKPPMPGLTSTPARRSASAAGARSGRKRGSRYSPVATMSA
ncbi:MAG TPA: hypothetical protein VHJ39_08195 [Solirubrobacteraceae bacterium]|nr:hypothetical protein [Solirubrobacteraceae bacterium]